MSDKSTRLQHPELNQEDNLVLMKQLDELVAIKNNIYAAFNHRPDVLKFVEQFENSISFENTGLWESYQSTKMQLKDILQCETEEELLSLSKK